MKQKALLISFFLAILVLAICLRFYKLDSIPPGLNQDEAVNGVDAYSFAHFGKDHHGNGPNLQLESYGDWVSPLLTYITIIPVSIWGLNVWTLRGTAAFLGVVTVAIMFFLSRSVSSIIFQNKAIWRTSIKNIVGLFGMLFLALSPWHVLMSRWAVPSVTVPLVTSLYVIIALNLFQSTPKSANRYLSSLSLGIIAGVGIFTYPTAKLFFPLLLAITFGILWREYEKPFFSKTFFFSIFNRLKANLLDVIPALVSFMMFFLPLMIQTLSDSKRYNFRLDLVSVFNQEINGIVLLIFNYSSYLSSFFLFGHGDTDAMRMLPHTGALGYGLLLPFICGLIGLFHFISKRRGGSGVSQKVISFILLWILISPIPASLTVPATHAFRVIQYIPVLILISALGIIFFLETIQKWTTQKVRILALSMLVLLFLEFSITSFYFYFLPYPRSVESQFQYGLERVLNRLEEENGKAIIVDKSINTPYIYVLFYQPDYINNTIQIVERPTGGGWNDVKRVENYFFEYVTYQQDGSILIHADTSPLFEYIETKEFTCMPESSEYYNGGDSISYFVYRCDDIIILDKQ